MNVESVQISFYLFQAWLVTWIRVASPCILFGLYYGLLSTFPIGPSHILSIRSFLLKGNASGIAALSGLMIGQLILFLSIFCSPLYILIIKPHVITLLIVPYMLFYWFRTKNLSHYRIFRPIGFLIDFQIYNILIDGFILQILNPMLLPSPVFARLIHLFLFRYSNNVIFLISTFLGWLIGHILFTNLCILLLVRIESDSPILYLLIKRIIHKTFSIIIYINVLLYLGKYPVSLFTHKIEDRLVLVDENFRELPDWILWIFKEWPTSWFDQYRPNRPIRYIRNSRFSGNSLVKRQVSTHFFAKCLTDGKERIALTMLPNLSIFNNQLRESSKDKDFDASLSNPYEYWISDQSIRHEALINNIRNRIRSLDAKCIFSKTIERRTELTNQKKRRLPRLYNPFLSNSYRVRIPISKSFWILCDLLEPKIDNNNKSNGQSDSYTRIEDWISNKYQQLNCDKIPLPWEILPPRAQQIFLFMFDDSTDIRINKIFNEIDVVYKENDLLSITSEVTWEQVFQLPLTERTLFFIYLKEDCNGFYWIDLLDIFSIDKKKRSFSSEGKVHSIYKIEKLLKELTHNSHLMFNNRFDIVGGVTDIRNRKLKNLGISVGKTGIRKIIKRFSETPDFRRRLIKGSMRSRRRKMVVWKLFQEKGHSPLFLRLMETPTLFQRPVKGFSDSEGLTIDPENETDIEFEQQSSSSSSLKNVQVLRLLLSARLDVGSVHTGRGLLLVLQSNLRKYVKLPILITFKNILRIFLFQVPEWNEDWNDWHKESHINCTYDGEEFSDTDLPGRWLKEGLQIKIVHPFRLKPWHNRRDKQSILNGNRINLKDIEVRRLRRKNKLGQKRYKTAYLTVWGFQTDKPFGTIQKDPSFWKPMKRELIKTWKNSISFRNRQIDSFYSRLGMPTMLGSSIHKHLKPFDRFRAIQDNSRQTNTIANNTLSNIDTLYRKKEETNSGKIDKESTHILNDSQSITGSDNRMVPDIFDRFGSKPGFLINQSNNSLPKKIDTNQQIIKSLDLIKEEIDRRLKNTNMISSLRFKKELIDIRTRSLRFRIGITKSIEKYLLPTIFLQRINRILYHFSVTLMTFQIQLVGVIKNTSETDSSISESTLVIPNTNKKILQLNDQSIGPLSQAYLYDNFWYTNGTDNVDLNNFLKTLKESETPKDPNNQKELDKHRDWDDYKKEWHREEYDDALKNDQLSTKRTESPRSLNCKNNKKKRWDSLEYLDNRNEIIEQYIDEPLKDLVMTQGVFKQLSDLTSDDWETWLKLLNRYNLPLELWHKIAPQQWRIHVENLNRFEEIERSLSEIQGRYVSHKDHEDFCLYMENPLLRDQLKNLNKRRKYTDLLSNLVNSLQRAGSEVLNNTIKEKSWSKDRIKSLIERNGSHQPIFDLEKELISKTDLALWLIPDAMKIKNLYKTASRFVAETCILEFGSLPDGQLQEDVDYGFIITPDEMFLKERLNHYYIFQWKWKSEALSKRLQRFKDSVSFMNVLEDKQDLTAFYNMDIDLDLFNRFLEEDKIKALEDLFIVSAHRLARVFDDQILMYKMVSILLKFRNRFRKRLDRDIFDDSKMRLLLMNRRIDRSYLYNIDDLLLPKRRRESQFLGSMKIAKGEKSKGYLLDSTSQTQMTNKSEESKDSSKTQIIKRFLWPSHRLEELACINRFYLNTSNGSRFAMLKIRMYTVI